MRLLADQPRRLPEGFDLDAYLRAGGFEYPEGEPMQLVVLFQRGPASVRNIAERRSANRGRGGWASAVERHGQRRCVGGWWLVVGVALPGITDEARCLLLSRSQRIHVTGARN